MGEEYGRNNNRIEVAVREFSADKDRERVEAVERICEVGPTGKLSLFTDLHGDPLCRVRHSPAFHMLVAEIGQEIVGMIRGCIKTVTCGHKPSRNTNSSQTTLPIYTKVAYILGLRVSPSHRRMGIGLKLVHTMEEWFRNNGAEYSYMATENDNLPSISLFTDKCGYSKFRTPSILVNPVFAHKVTTSKNITILKLSPHEAEKLYKKKFSTTEFFPRDIHNILNNKLNLGTFLAFQAGPNGPDKWAGLDAFLSGPPESWAVMSVWNCKEVFTLEVRGASRVKRALAKTTRVLDRVLPFLKVSSFPDLFRPFGVHFLYGLGGEGREVGRMVRALCGHAHNVAKARGCGAVVTEVASCEPLRLAIPHWKMLSCAEDL